MIAKEKLYDAFGELIYLVAMADGVIQKEETQALKTILNSHPWAKEVKWSFNYEADKNKPLEYVYKRALDIFHQNGPDPEYAFFVDVLREVAKASNGIDKNEEELINRFTHELTQRFKDDIDKISARNRDEV